MTSDETAPPYGDPVEGLVRAAVCDRPLDEVVRLITLLEQSPEYAQTAHDALRTVGVDRSVEDVTGVVTLLTQPPREPDSAYEAIRAAAEYRSVEDVTRLMALLHRPPLEPQCGLEAVRAAATGRPVEELVQLIGQLVRERSAHEEAARPESSAREAAGRTAEPLKAGSPTARVMPGTGGRESGTARTGRARRVAAPARTGGPPAWPGRLAVAALVVCAAACFPLHRNGASLGVYGVALGVSGVCVLLALALAVRAAVPVLVPSVLVPAGLAAAQVLEGRFRPPGLARVLDIAAAPPWVTGLAAVVAALAALTALFVTLGSERPALRRREY